jgi:3-oxoacyl-[acyl-carrier-protein] synthase II
MDRRRVVITGLGVATPIGLGVEAFWDGLIQRRCGLRRIESFDASAFPTPIAGELPSFSLGDFIPKSYRKSAKVMSRDITIAVVAAYHAVKDARLSTRCLVERGESDGPVSIDSTRFGANIGAGLIAADLEELAEAMASSADESGRFSLKRWGTEGMNNLTPLWLLKFLPNMLACHVTIVHDAQGPSNTITCGEASSHLAIGEAFRTIARGDADVCICGGSESRVNPSALVRPQLLRYANTEAADTPERAVRPFDPSAPGTVYAEGGGLIILESLDHARARGARIYAELVGFGAANRTTHWLDPDSEGSAIALALNKALRDAGTTPDGVDLAVPFGFGTKDHDASEAAAWNAVFGTRLGEIPALTTHGAIGVNGAGSGAIDFAAAVLAMHNNTLPPSLNTDHLGAACRFRFVQGDPTDAPIQQAVSVGHAMYGGQCAALVIRRLTE